MTQGDLQRIEKAIGRSLSVIVRRFFLNYPPELRTTIRALGPDDDGNMYPECAADNELCDSADHLIEMNDREGGWAADYPDNILILGAGECGETYWVDLDDEKGAVHRFDAGTDVEDSDQPWGSIDEFARAMIDSYRDR